MIESSDSESEYDGAILTELHPMRLGGVSLANVYDEFEGERDDYELHMGSERNENTSNSNVTAGGKKAKTRKLTPWTAFQKANMVSKLGLLTKKCFNLI